MIDVIMVGIYDMELDVIMVGIFDMQLEYLIKVFIKYILI